MNPTDRDPPTAAWPCDGCGYDLRGAIQAEQVVCPECGTTNAWALRELAQQLGSSLFRECVTLGWIAGIGAAFLFAGLPALVAGLWPVAVVLLVGGGAIGAIACRGLAARTDRRRGWSRLFCAAVAWSIGSLICATVSALLLGGVTDAVANNCLRSTIVRGCFVVRADPSIALGVGAATFGGVAFGAFCFRNWLLAAAWRRVVGMDG